MTNQKPLKQPIKHCYWVKPNQILAGEYPRNKDDQSSQEKLDGLIEAGVNLFIDLTEEDEGLSPYSNLINLATHFRFPIRDVSVPNSIEATKAILDAIDHGIENDKTVYVHCWGGVGRTGLVIGCWLARHGLGGEKALARLQELWKECPKSAWRQSPETPEQVQYILNWKLGQ